MAPCQLMGVLQPLLALRRIRVLPSLKSLVKEALPFLAILTKDSLLILHGVRYDTVFSHVAIELTRHNLTSLNWETKLLP